MLGQGIFRSIQACCEYIVRHLADKISISQLAKEAGYSEYYLLQKFKNEMGESVAQYIKEKQAEQAQLILKGTNESIQTISEDLGLFNASHFAKTFSEVTGMTQA